MEDHDPGGGQGAVRDDLARLFREHETLRAVIESVLECRLGRIKVGGPGSGRLALLELGCYAIVGGSADEQGAAELLTAIERPRELVLPPDQRWRDRVHSVFGAAVEDRPMRTFSSHALDPIQLRRMARCPAGIVILPMGLAEARALGRDLEPHGVQAFGTPEALTERGLGFCAQVNGALVGQCSSYAVSTRRVEVAVATSSAFRGRGIAQALAATMLLHCLERGLSPEWSASNPVSKRLALRLGYRPGPLCDSLYLG